MSHLLRAHARQRAPRRLRGRRGGDRRLRARPSWPWASFIGAPHPDREIVFTKNATESFNLFAHAWGRTELEAGDVVVLTEMEHHANIVPWLPAPRGAAASSCATCPSTTHGAARPARDSTASLDGRAAALGHRDVQRARHDPPGARPRRRRARARARSSRSTPPSSWATRRWTSPSSARRRGVLQRAQDARADRDRRAVGARGAARARCRRSSAAAG